MGDWSTRYRQRLRSVLLAGTSDYKHQRRSSKDPRRILMQSVRRGTGADSCTGVVCRCRLAGHLQGVHLQTKRANLSCIAEIAADTETGCCSELPLSSEDLW